MGSALEGLTVLEVSSGMAGSSVGMLFADNGAEVIRVEPPGGAPDRDTPGWEVRNRGKRSMVLDLATPDGREQFRSHSRTSDAIVWALRPGRAEEWDLTHERLAADNPALCSLSITGFGERGPWRDLPGHEGLVAARSGRMASTTGHREGPVFTPTPIASFGAAMLGASGLLAALYQQRRTGRGRRVQTSLLHALVSYDMVSGPGHRIHQPDKSDRVYGVLPLAFMTAPTADGRWIQMCSRQPHLFRNWMRLLELEHLFDEPGLEHLPDLVPDQQTLDELCKLIAERMRRRSLDDWLALFAEHDVGGDPFLTAEEYLHHAQTRANGRVVEVQGPGSQRSLQVGPLGVFSDTPSQIGRPAPQLGDAADGHGDRGSRAAADAAASSTPAPGMATDLDGPTPARGTPTDLPLQGITILEIAYFYATPWASTLLAEMGARVIKVEPPTGDPSRRNWMTDYAKEMVGKESIVLDLKTEDGRRLLHELVARADVFLHNFRPGVAERLEVDAATLLAIRPELVYLYGGCFGSEGPWARRPGFHSSPNAIAGSGVLEAGRGNPPQNRTFADPAGALATAACIMTALTARDRTGRGQYVETTMLSSMAHAVAAWSTQYEGRPQAPPVDPGQHGFHALHRLYPTGDGWLFLQAEREDEVARLGAALDLAELTDPLARDRADDDAGLAALIEDRLSVQSADDWERELTAVGVPAARADGIDHLDFMLQHEQMVANQLAVDTAVDGQGTLRRSAGSVEFDGRWPEPRPTGVLGDATTAILTELGYDPEAIHAFHDRGVTRASGHGLND